MYAAGDNLNADARVAMQDIADTPSGQVPLRLGNCVPELPTGRRMRWPMSKNCVHKLFLFFFIVFLIVGVALTCVGFMNSGSHGLLTGSKSFRVLGIVALLLCIGFLIAACVILSECVTSAIKYHGLDFNYYQTLYPSYTESLQSAAYERHIASSLSNQISLNESHSLNSFGPYAHAGNTASMADDDWMRVERADRPSVHMCPSCSCHLLQPTSYPEGVVQLRNSSTVDGPSASWSKQTKLQHPSQLYPSDSESDSDNFKVLVNPQQVKEWV